MKTFGEKLRELRKNRGLSQSQLAEQVGVTSQAVSKWETDTSTPELTMLPVLASLFGVQIDDLFEYSRDKRYEKIANGMEYWEPLTNAQFESNERFLLNEIEQDQANVKATKLLADLYNYQADSLHKKAGQYAKKAIELTPNDKGAINALTEAEGGYIYDWNVHSHNSLISYYYNLLKNKPENKRVYFYLIDNLIDDGRLKEASKVLDEAKINNPDSLNDVYALWIEERMAGFSAVEPKYKKLLEDSKDDWRVIFAIAIRYAFNEHYEETIELCRLAFKVMEPPRYTDFFDAMAQCYLRIGQKEKAAECYKDVIKVLKEEWGIKFGGEIDHYKALADELLRITE